ncbi:hypothetical protein HZQ94_10440 [Elizabethkingia anophelis]|uniref:hypothetical protein n=1 Tax=Elizabethkingia anophelis TaxID=1117645 RepID=UPI0021A49301|nr:hypothetical protein [Elizabethkingia anophelis]MCT3680823.1 hypothetical protein [Elizabethkingia anophelis]
MNITTYHLLQALAIDSIYNVLSWYDRANAHLFLVKKADEITDKTFKLAEIVAKNNIEAPKMVYRDDRFLYYRQEYKDCAFMDLKPEWLPIDQYRAFNPKVTELIKNFK